MHPHEPKRIDLAQLPTPIVELKNLARQSGVPRVLVKRDDLTGLELSGNKIRKLEYVAADALANRATSLVTMGAAQSNHCRATAALGARMGCGAAACCARPSPDRRAMELLPRWAIWRGAAAFTPG